MSDNKKTKKKIEKIEEKKNVEEKVKKNKKPEVDKIEPVINIEPEKKKMKIYIDFKVRVVLYAVLLITFFSLTFLFLLKSFDFSNSQMISYNENSNLDYKVYLKENEFYESEYLGEDKIYVASLIDRIIIDFGYDFDIEANTNIDFSYEIIGKLSINDESTNSTYFDKEYKLISNKTAQMVNTNNFHLNEQVVIDYDFYNNLANNFKQTYGVDTVSNLNVYMKINKKNATEEDLKINDESIMLMTIPLSQKAIDIKMDYQEIDNSSYIIEDESIILSNIGYILLTAICLLVTLVLVVRLIRLLTLLGSRKSVYDKYIGKILKEYDRLIVENYTGPKLDESNIIKIKKFEELLDVRDNLKLPVMYYTVAKHQKCYFYIKHNQDLYLLVVKAVDLEENK